MKTAELWVGVDEFNLVLQTQAKVDVMDWPDTVDRILERFLQRSKIEEIFSELIRGAGTAVQGYNEGLFAAHKPFYFAICWHDAIQSMGIAVRFTAHAWAYFQAEYEARHQTEMNILHFLKMVQSVDLYTTRLSRIDLTADYINYGLQVHAIYRDLKSKKLQPVNWKLNRTNLQMSAIEKDGVAETIYLGSKKGNTQGFLRIYDKRDEQIAKHGFQLDEALAADNWIRFEASFRGKYAHQITEGLLTEVSDSVELQKFIACKICDKYIFFDVEKDAETDFSEALFGIAKGSKFKHLRAESPRDNTLKQSIRYLVTNAGLMPVLHKIHCVYGDVGLDQFWKYLKDQYDLYEPNRDVAVWLNKHYSTMRKQSLTDSLF